VELGGLQPGTEESVPFFQQSPGHVILPNKVPGKISQAKAPDQTFEEVKYLRHLIDDHVPVRVRLSDNQEVDGVVEFYDANFIRITRTGEPNLFLFKHDIKYLYELS
jgi:sRNA-binding regulator protein Hfq